MCSAGEIAATHSVSKLNGNACRENIFNSHFKVGIINFLNSVQNGYTLFAFGEPTDILVDYHSFFVFAFVKQCVRLIITDKRYYKSNEQYRENCRSNYTRDTNRGSPFSFSLVFLCFETLQFRFAFTGSAFFFCTDSGFFFGFLLIRIPFFKTNVQRSNLIICIPVSANGLKFFDAV